MPTDTQRLPLSENQRGLWHLQNIHPELHTFNSSAVFRVRTQLNIPRLQQKLFHLSDLHPLLRTTFVLQDDTPLQLRHETLHPGFDHIVVSAVDEAALRTMVQAAHERSFDLATGPLVRLALFTRTDDDHILLLSFHHILIDFGTIARLTQQLFDLYAGDTVDAPPLTGHVASPISYDDFVAWQQAQLTRPTSAKLRDYWSQQLQAPLPVLDLPTDYPLPRQQTFNGSTIRFTLPNDLSQKLLNLAHRQKVTPFTLLLTAYALLLARYGKQDDLIIGIPSDERLRAPQRFRQTLGHMVNALPIRFNLTDRPTFVDLLQQTQRAVLHGVWHQNYPFTYMVQDAQVLRDISRFPLFDVMFNMPVLHTETNFIPWVEGTTAQSVTYQGLPLEPFALHQQAAHTFLELTIWSVDTGIVGILKYNTDLFTQARAEVIATQYQHLLTQISMDATCMVDTYTLITPTMQAWLPDLSKPIAEPHYALIPTLIRQWVARTPNQMAIAQGTATYSYVQTMDMALAIAQWLHAQTLPKGTVVAIQGGNSPLLVTSMLAVLLNGNVFVLVDPTLPSQRRQAMMAVAQPKAYILISADKDAHSQLNRADVALLHLCSSANVETVLTPNHEVDIVWPILSPEDPAYIFFTSGTTGTPKGIVGTHKGLAHFLHWQRDTFSITPADRVAQLTALSFDAVLRAIFLPLVSGATLVLPEVDDILLSGEKLLSWLDNNRISLVHVVPSLAQSWLIGQTVTATLQTLRWLFFSGEPLTSSLIAQWRETFPNAGAIVNLYGPTETTLVKCYYQVPEKVQPGVQPIGRPQPATQVVTINQERLCGVGELGEIMIRTPFRTQGYLQRQDTFAQNPFSSAANDLVYYTGDYGRLRPDGLIDILGRVDTQVKIRGVRIELQEVEAVLMRHPSVQKAVVVAHGEAADKRLVAYLIPTNLRAEAPFLKEAVTRQSDVTSPKPSPKVVTSIRTFLQQTLPGYMIPAAFVLLEAIPLTPTGKLDRRALPVPDYVDTYREFVAPRTELETQLAAIWQAVLGIAPIGIDDNFFALGGHSLLATQIISRVRQQLHLDVPIKTLFEAAQLGAFAQRLAQLRATTGRNAESRIPAQVRMGQPPYAFPLSFSQQRLWFLDQMEPESAFYNIPFILRLTGELDITALQASFRYLIARHESLRTVFGRDDSNNGEPRQVIHPPDWATHFTLPITLMPDASAQHLAQEEATTPFNLTRGPLLRAHLFLITDETAVGEPIAPHRTEQHYLLVVTIHHIISDGWSMRVFIQELNQAYCAYVAGKQPLLPDLPIQYADFARWQRDYLSGETLEMQLAYWRDHLRGAPALLELPTDRARPPAQSYQGATHSFHLSMELTSQLQQLAQQQDATLYMVLLATFNVLLARYSQQKDIVVGTVIANRNRAEIEGLIGLFTNTLALRTRLDDNPSFITLLTQVRQTTLAAYTHQDLPFEQLVDALALERTLSYNPIFQVMLILQNAERGTVDFPNVAAATQTVKFPFARFDLTLYVTEYDTGLMGMVEYNTDLFDETTIVRMIDHFVVLLNAIVAHPEQPVLQLPLLTAAEYQQIVYDWNTTAVHFDPVQTIATLFEQQVAGTPDAIAVVCPKVEVRKLQTSSTVPDLAFLSDDMLTYRELNEHANRLAHYLQGLGVGPDVVVGLLAERSLNFLIAMIAILKAGGAYLPLEPRNPIARQAQILQQSQCSLVLCAESLITALREELTTAATAAAHALPLLLSLEQSLTQKHSSENLLSGQHPDNLAYVIFTSGSTGLPKGVMVEQRGKVNHLLAIINELRLSASDRIAQTASQAFDISVWQFLAALMVGGRVYIYPDDISLNPDRLLEQIGRDQITIWQTVPSLLRAILSSLQQMPQMSSLLDNQSAQDKALSTLRWLIPTGEALPPLLANQWLKLYPQIPLLNAYGPAECSDDVTYYPIYQPLPPTIVNTPIGRPIGNMRTYILDNTLQPLPIGIPGELWIGGVGVGRGYLHDPERTATAFVSDPFVSNSPSRLYKTGDLCRWLPDGNIEYIGRSDFQVKIRGFRIELGEIENALLAQSSVREAVVLAREDTPGDKRLVAYVVQKAGEDADACTLPPETLRQGLAQLLPDYMIPAAIVTLDVMPLTSNGKLDRRALPVPDYAGASKSYVPPQTVDEARLVLLWQEVMGVHPIGVTNNFFELGGHSLLAVHLVQRMRQTLGRDLALRQIFATPTIRSLLQSLDHGQPVVTSFVPLRAGNQSCPPLFLIHAGSGVVFPFVTLLPYLRTTQPVYALQARGIYDDLPPFDSLEALATQTIHEMKRIQPHGPYHLGGWSFGGMAAFAIARQLQAQGDAVAFLGILDAYPRTGESRTASAAATPEEELQAFFYLLGDIMQLDYRSVDNDLFVHAMAQADPVARLLEQLSEQGVPLVMDPAIIKRIWTTLKQNRQLMQTYQPQWYDGAITLFCAEESAPDDGAQRWQALTPHLVETVWVKGEHNTMLNTALVEKLGRELEKRLQAVTGG